MGRRYLNMSLHIDFLNICFVCLFVSLDHCFDKPLSHYISDSTSIWKNIILEDTYPISFYQKYYIVTI